MNKLKVTNCKECPYIAYANVEDKNVLYAPMCNKEKRVIPYKYSRDPDNTTALFNGEIPKWCNL